MSFQELNEELIRAQKEYEESVFELNHSHKAREEAEIAMIRADAAYRRLRLEVTVAKTRIDSLREQSYNSREEASI